MSVKKCSFCKAKAKGKMEALIDLGWAWAVIYAPKRGTITACPEHRKELKDALNKALRMQDPKWKFRP